MSHLSTVSEVLKKWEEKGFSSQLTTKDGKIYCLNTKQYFPVEQVKLVKSYRFEGQTNPSDSSELFLIECDSQTKGSLLMAYGAKTDIDAQVIKALK